MKAAEYALWKTMNETWLALGQLWPILSVPLWFAIFLGSIILASFLLALWTILWRRDYHVVQRECLEWNQASKKYQISSYQEVRPGPEP